MSSQNIEYIEEDLNPPDWLNKEFFQEVLQHCENQNVIVLLELRLQAASSKNDQYASSMFRAVIKYSSNGEMHSKSLIIKTMPEIDGEKKEFLKDTSIFETEIGMYTEVIPKFQKILQSAGDDTQFGPNCVYHSLSPRKLIIFEDMIPHGYTVLSKRQTNYEESKAIYSKIAKWHAISYKINQEQPEFFRDYQSKAFTELRLKYQQFSKDGIRNFIEMLNEHEDLRNYRQYFEPLKDTILDYVEAAFNEYLKNPKQEAYYVLCHGDFHHRNMLFKYDEVNSNLLDVLLIDYQMCYIGPIVNDIINSTFMLIDTESRAKKLDELLYFYFTTFQETLRKIGFNGTMPNMIEFRAQLVSHRRFGLFQFASCLPILYATYGNYYDLAEMLGSAEKRKAVYRNPKYVDEVRRLLPIYLHLGYLENL